MDKPEEVLDSRYILKRKITKQPEKLDYIEMISKEVKSETIRQLNRLSQEVLDFD